MDAPTVPPGIRHWGPRPDLPKRERTADPSGPEPELQPLLVDLDGHRAQGKHAHDTDESDEPQNRTRADLTHSENSHHEPNDGSDAGDGAGLCVFVHALPNLCAPAASGAAASSARWPDNSLRSSPSAGAPGSGLQGRTAPIPSHCARDHTPWGSQTADRERRGRTTAASPRD